MSPLEYYRTFISITPDPAVLNSLDEQIVRLRRDLEVPGIRWESQEKWHVTLRFLGDVAADQIPELCGVIETVCNEARDFTAQVAGIGAFPSLKRPRILWAGVESEGEELADLHRKLGSAVDRFAAKPDEKRFHPHLTLARIRTENRRAFSQIQPAVQPFADLDFGTWRVRHVELFRSRLQAGGSKYELLSRVALKADDAE